MRIAFFISSVGDSDLALKTIKSLEHKGDNHETFIISLTKTAQQRVEVFQSPSTVIKTTLPEILQSDKDLFPEGVCTENQLEKVELYIHSQQIDYAYFGVPSISNEIPFQLAERLNIPVLMAYEFMFKPETHCLWKHVPILQQKSNVQWALPLADAHEDFQIDDKSKIHITGHLSIDNAYAISPSSTRKPEEIKDILNVPTGKSLAFVSSTTQPVEIDAGFLDCLLTELKHHPNMEVRLGLHPGIQNMDVYLAEILAIYKKHPDVVEQFKIILPDNLVSRVKQPELTINAPMFQNAFLRVNVTGSEAASAASRIAQAVPGALLNQAVLEGKPAYSHLGKPYLPRQYFSNSISSFFAAAPNPPRSKEDLGLDEKTTPERYAEIITIKT
ncbi:Uncharacterised protein [Legionella lansingensis]|uniref:Uncharacterized protein n=1 Tax=Legionella lansingensis TaxID=45067 RepID=A0A0W0VR72_9GAMM|nr:hypothetical protein [Legionella lansingensis]KTD22695.1 hypothetical protein Llan_1185 [Legionella lansingensis]SNV55515.1 Uncharacterised protein [Legionella lansingensis]